MFAIAIYSGCLPELIGYEIGPEAKICVYTQWSGLDWIDACTSLESLFLVAKERKRNYSLDGVSSADLIKNWPISITIIRISREVDGWIDQMALCRSQTAIKFEWESIDEEEGEYLGYHLQMDFQLRATLSVCIALQQLFSKGREWEKCIRSPLKDLISNP